MDNLNYNPYKAVIFDVDGTIWNSSKEVAESWALTLSQIAGRPYEMTPQMLASVMGLAMDEIAKRLVPSSLGGLKREEIMARLMEGENSYLRLHPGRFFEGISEAIPEIAQSYPVYILSNCQSGYIEAMLSNASFAPCIKRHLCFGDDNLDKAENLAILIKEEKLEKALYIGDTLHDEEETHKAGLPFVHASYGFGKAKAPEAVALGPSDFPNIVRIILG